MVEIKTKFPAYFNDHLQNTIYLLQAPQRIISLVPSQTELLFDLGLGKKLVGITKFCIHPKPQVNHITKIGGTKNFNLDTIHELKPDLIIGNKEENYQEGIEALQAHYPVWLSDILTLKDALNMISHIGQLTDTVKAAKTMTDLISEGFNTLHDFSAVSTAYFIWLKPYMVAGADTFINDVLKAAGLTNVFSQNKRYPLVKAKDLQKAQPKIILLSSEPYPFKEKHIKEMREICPYSIIKLVDGELFSWYGSRLKYTPTYIKNLRAELGIEISEI